MWSLVLISSNLLKGKEKSEQKFLMILLKLLRYTSYNTRRDLDEKQTGKTKAWAPDNQVPAYAVEIFLKKWQFMIFLVEKAKFLRTM